MEAERQDLTAYRRIVLLTDGFATPFLAKTAISLLRYRPSDIAAVLESKTSATTAGELFGIESCVPVVSRLDQVEQADSLFIGIAPPGGKLPSGWRGLIRQAIERRLDIVSGLHDFLSEDDQWRELASRYGSRLIDVRCNRLKVTAEGYRFPDTCVRIQTVGHDCTVGKMVASLEVQRELSRRGHDAAFLATGQTGIMIGGVGVPADCVVSDFINGAVEQLVREHEGHEFVLIEGQGSLSHPAFSAVTLGLLHGAAPDGLIFCYEAGRGCVKGLTGVPIPPMRRIIEALEAAARLRHPCRVIGIAVNTRGLDTDAADREVAQVATEFGLPATDVYRHGVQPLADAAETLKTELATA